MNQPGQKPRLSIVQHKADNRLRLLAVAARDASIDVIRRAFDPIQKVLVDITPDTENATRLLATRSYDLVAVDPATSPGGFELLRHVKDNSRWTATLVATLNQDPQFLREAIKCRIDGLLFRPAPASEFVEQAMLLAEEASLRRRSQQKRVLAIGAHPDDVEIGCGGALAKHHAAGDVLHILTMSRGEAGGEVNLRATEARAAAAMIGAGLDIANLRDTHIAGGAETISIIEAAIEALNATHVYTHSMEDTHQDHRAIHAATVVAARGVPNVYCYQSPSSTVEFRPLRFVDITHVIDKKIDLIGAYKSQVGRMASLQPDVILSTARYWGRFAGYVLAEPLEIIRQRDGGQSIDPGHGATAVTTDDRTDS